MWRARGRNRGGRNRGGRGRGRGEQEEWEFGEACNILRDWRATDHIIGPVVDQGDDAISWAIVIARVIEAAYNIDNSGSDGCFVEVSYDHIVTMVKGKGSRRLELGSFKKCFKTIRNDGAAKLSPTLTQNYDKAKKLKRTIPSKDDANMEFIMNKVDLTPLGIVIAVDDNFHTLGQEIYTPRQAQPNSDLRALLVVGHGETLDGRRFLITQNSRNTSWGRLGYGRIALENNVTCFTFYPVSM